MGRASLPSSLCSRACQSLASRSSSAFPDSSWVQSLHTIRTARPSESHSVDSLSLLLSGKSSLLIFLKLYRSWGDLSQYSRWLNQFFSRAGSSWISCFATSWYLDRYFRTKTRRWIHTLHSWGLRWTFFFSQRFCSCSLPRILAPPDNFDQDPRLCNHLLDQFFYDSLSPLCTPWIPMSNFECCWLVLWWRLSLKVSCWLYCMVGTGQTHTFCKSKKPHWRFSHKHHRWIQIHKRHSGWPFQQR